MDIVLEHVQIWKITVYIFCWYIPVTWPWRHGWNILLIKPIIFGVNGKKIFCWSIFAIEPIAGFCPFLGYWPSKNASRDHDIKDKFVSFANSIVLYIIGKRILCWSIIAIEHIADFSKFWRFWPSKNGSRDHDIKDEFVCFAKAIVFDTAGKKVLCSLNFL